MKIRYKYYEINISIFTPCIENVAPVDEVVEDECVVETRMTCLFFFQQ